MVASLIYFCYIIGYLRYLCTFIYLLYLHSHFILKIIRIILTARNPHDLENQLRILKDFFSNMGMTVNTDKTKFMVIKSNKITYYTFIYENNNLEELTSYKYIGINIHHKLNWNYNIKKKIIGGWKIYYGLENKYKSVDLWIWDKKKLLFETLITNVILYGC
jgi:hypothetical protein